MRAPKKRWVAWSLAMLSAVPAWAAWPDRADVLSDMKRVADWQMEHMPHISQLNNRRETAFWVQAPFYLGLFDLYLVSGDERYLERIQTYGRAFNYQAGPGPSSANNNSILQPWLNLYAIDQDPAILRPAIETFNRGRALIDDARQGKTVPPPGSLGQATAIPEHDVLWFWADALWMAPPVWFQLSEITGDPQYAEWADKQWWAATDLLYDPQYRLFYRDKFQFDRRTKSGHKVFWGRGTGWVIGGLVNLLSHFPPDGPNLDRYLGLYREMVEQLVTLQGPDGLWHTSLLDPEGDDGDTSATGFIVQALAWGVNRGLLPEDPFRESALKGWAAMVKCIRPDGRIGRVQGINHEPVESIEPDATASYGSGAFLLAGAEIARMVDPTLRRRGRASFDGVVLPERYRREAPRVHARFVPEREDDFAWENDLIAFRAFGPALREKAERGGFDAWLKRVPWPIVDKWFIENATAFASFPRDPSTKSYHKDQGEGYDPYKVGPSLGCGGTAIWLDGRPRDLNTFVAHRIIKESPEQVVFELDYADTIDGTDFRETRRITVVLGSRLFEVESRFTVDGRSEPIEVAIGLKPQSPETREFFAPSDGKMALWDVVDGLGLGTAVVTDPSSVVKMLRHNDPLAGDQALCIVRSDENGTVRYRVGYGWEGQGVISTAEAWLGYLRELGSASD